MNLDKQKLIKMFALLIGIVIVVWALTQIFKNGSKSLSDYALENPELQNQETLVASEETTDVPSTNGDITTKDATSESHDISGNPDTDEISVESTQENLQNVDEETGTLLPIGGTLNGDSQIDERVSYTESFYYEPLSDNLRRYITGVSFPELSENSENSDISYEELRYVHILHYDFDGKLAEGELICNMAIAQDLVEIFHELYRNEYRIEKVKLIDEYDGDDNLSMADNNTSCFNYRNVPESTSLSKHALGRAIDINPLYNPYITYNEDGSENILPENATDYADRSKKFPYKIDEDDLCYKLFTEHGFVWGGNWNSCKDYQHFQKVN